MISSIHIKNYRCFPDLDLSDLGQINIIVGDNGAGKTALLEAILLAAGVPEVVVLSKQMRGIQQNIQISPDQQRTAQESIWNDIFTGLSPNKVIEISLDGSPENRRKVRIYYENESQRVIPIASQFPFAVGNNQSSMSQIVFESEDMVGHHDLLRPKLIPGGAIAVQGDRTVPPAAIFLHGSCAPPVQQQSVQDFDAISKRKGEPALIEAIAKVYPQIKDISVIEGMLHCSLPEFPEKIPLSVISNGLNKLVAIMLGIANRSGGVYMIDEIENGFYYQRLPKIWDSVDKFSEEYNVQLFISTHSKECLQALLPIVERNPSKFRLIRLENSEKNNHLVDVFGGDVLRAILKTGEIDARSGE